MGVGQLGGVGGGPELGHEEERLRPVALGASRGGQPGGEPVDLDAQQADVAEVVGARRRGHQPARRRTLDEAVALEAPQRFAHRRAADLEAFGQVDLPQPLARADDVGQQLTAELVVGRLVGGPLGGPRRR